MALVNEKAMKRIMENRDEGMVVAKGELYAWRNIVPDDGRSEYAFNSDQNLDSPQVDSQYIIIQLEHDFGLITAYDCRCSGKLDFRRNEIDSDVAVGDHVKLVMKDNCTAVWKKDIAYSPGLCFYDEGRKEKAKKNPFFFKGNSGYEVHGNEQTLDNGLETVIETVTGLEHPLVQVNFGSLPIDAIFLHKGTLYAKYGEEMACEINYKNANCEKKEWTFEVHYGCLITDSQIEKYGLTEKDCRRDDMMNCESTDNDLLNCGVKFIKKEISLAEDSIDLKKEYKCREYNSIAEGIDVTVADLAHMSSRDKFSELMSLLELWTCGDEERRENIRIGTLYLESKGNHSEIRIPLRF